MHREYSFRLMAGMLGAALVVAGCSAEHDESHDMAAEHAGEHHAHVSMAAGEPISGQSLHQLDAAWADQHGQSVRLADFAGRTVVLAMVYTHCDNACPRIIADMRRIAKALADEPQAPILVLASIDPQRDTVAHLEAFGKETGLSAQGWRLLRASDGTVRELAAVLGVQYRRISDTDFAHSNIISVLGPGGEIEHQQQGLGAAPDATIATIRRLAGETGG